MKFGVTDGILIGTNEFNCKLCKCQDCKANFKNSSKEDSEGFCLTCDYCSGVVHLCDRKE